jgi:hypothetical protein
MSSSKKMTETEDVRDKELEETEQSNDEESDDDDDENSENDDRIPIDLSQNEIYRGVCTLLEDEEGNNILEYISLLHTELIGINKSLENLKLIRKDITRLADCAELIVKGKKSESRESSGNTKEHTREHTREKTSSSKKV